MSNNSNNAPADAANSSGAAANQSGDINLGEDLSMNRIIDFLRDQQRATYSRDTDFLFEKQQMMTRIN